MSWDYLSMEFNWMDELHEHDIKKAAKTVAYDQECRIEQLHIDLEHAMAQNKALVAHSLEMDDAIMQERKRAYRENKAFQVEQAKEIENLELELERVTGREVVLGFPNRFLDKRNSANGGNGALPPFV